MSWLQIVGYDASDVAFAITPNYIEPSTSPTQGAYVDVSVEREASRLEFLLAGNGQTYSYAALSEIELFAEESPEHLR